MRRDAYAFPDTVLERYGDAGEFRTGRVFRLC